MAGNEFSVSELISNKTYEYNNIILDYYSLFIDHYAFKLPENFDITNYYSWIWAMLGSVVVGMSGIFPLLVIPLDETATLKDGAGARTLRVLLSFAVGGLLGDVFLHLLPEAWGNPYSTTVELSPAKHEHPSLACGLWVLAGLLVFIIIEKIFSFEKEEEDPTSTEPSANLKSMPMRRKRSSFILNDLTCCQRDGVCYKELLQKSSSKQTVAAAAPTAASNNDAVGVVRSSRNKSKDRPPIRSVSKKSVNASVNASVKEKKPDNNNAHHPNVGKKGGPGSIRISGYLNLMANSIDNFTHGLAVGGSFLLSTRVGLLTTFAILVHEIPHEVGDFAILLRAGFSRWDAAWAQVYTASAGIVGALTALIFSASSNSVEARTSWILPFTAGGFLHIALVTVLPELLEEKDPKESIKQMCSLASGITVMALLTALVDH